MHDHCSQAEWMDLIIIYKEDSFQNPMDIQTQTTMMRMLSLPYPGFTPIAF